MSFVFNFQSGRTPLHEAASQQSNARGVEILVKAGAYVNVVDKVSCFQVPQCANS